jgi:transaldolase
MTDSIQKLHQLGQSLWYDNIQRRLLEDGTFSRMIEKDEIRGVTSNPSIFNKAIGNSQDYDREIWDLTSYGKGREEIYEQLVIADIQRAADLFLPLFQETGGGDGYVSLEVNPHLAHDTEGTVTEAQRLWEQVDRPNLMVKIPATKAGLPAIRRTTAAGINVNVTLIFSIERYREVIQAYLDGLADRVERGKSIEGIASVASFFISRIETRVDQRLAELIENDPDRKTQLEALFGKAAVASGKIAYQVYQEMFGDSSQAFQKLKKQGASRQRVLWASTSTKDPRYSDVKYVEEMIGPDSVNTVPQQTLEAFRDHGKAELTITQDVEQARQALQTLDEVGVDLEQITQNLEEAGVRSFAEAYDGLLDTIQERMEQAATSLL